MWDLIAANSRIAITHYTTLNHQSNKQPHWYIQVVEVWLYGVGHKLTNGCIENSLFYLLSSYVKIGLVIFKTWYTCQISVNKWGLFLACQIEHWLWLLWTYFRGWFCKLNVVKQGVECRFRFLIKEARFVSMLLACEVKVIHLKKVHFNFKIFLNTQSIIVFLSVWLRGFLVLLEDSRFLQCHQVQKQCFSIPKRNLCGHAP